MPIITHSNGVFNPFPWPIPLPATITAEAYGATTLIRASAIEATASGVANEVATSNAALRQYAVTPMGSGGGLGVLKPSTETCGVLPNVSRTPVAGNVTLSTDGQLYENRSVTGRITIAANTNNVTIRNCSMHDVNCDAAGITGLVIEDFTIRPTTPAFTFGGGIVGHDFTARRGIITGHIDGMVVRNTSAAQPYSSGVVVEHCIIGPLAWWTDDQVGTVHSSDRWSHNDGCQHMGGWNSSFIGNWWRGFFEPQYAHWQSTTYPTEPYVSVAVNSLPDGGPWFPIPDRGGASPGTAANGRYNTDNASPQKSISLTNFLIGNNVGTSRQLTFSYNWVDSGDLAFNGGGFNRGSETNLLITATGNRFDRTRGNQASNPLTSGFGSGWVGSAFAVLTSNVYEDNGAPI